MTGLRLVPALAVLSACAPQNATLVNGSYIAFIGDSTSISLQKEAIDPEKYNAKGEPCGEGAVPGDSCYYDLDCRTFDNGGFASQNDEDALRLEDTIDICGANKWPPQHEEWATTSGFRVVTEALDPWRGEALVTSEGDLQIAFHHHVPGGADLRFILAVDPDFSPTTCVTDPDSGKVERVPYDGDWVEMWSRGTEAFPQGLAFIETLPEDDPETPGELVEAYEHLLPYLDGKLYLLNDDSYQLNPSDTNDFWYFPTYWQAGSNIGKFVEEDIGNRSPRYAEPWVYNFVDLTGGYSPQPEPGDLFYCEDLVVFGGDPEENGCMANLDMRTKNIATEIRDELDRMMSPTGKADDTVFKYAPISHTNFWRPPDGRGAGLDGWAELHYNYIVFDKASDLSVGGNAKGAFSLVFDAYESATRVFVKGEFEIDKIKRDHWTAKNLQEEKLIENDVELCNAASEHEADPKDVPDPALE